MSLYSWFTRNNLKNKETLAKYWNPIPLSISTKPTERPAPNFRLQSSVVNLDDYGDKFLNEIGEKYE